MLESHAIGEKNRVTISISPTDLAPGLYIYHIIYRKGIYDGSLYDVVRELLSDWVFLHMNETEGPMDYLLPYLYFDHESFEKTVGAGRIDMIKSLYNSEYLKKYPNVMLIKPLTDVAREFYTDHSTYHEGDSGIDLFCLKDQVVVQYVTSKIELGIQCQANTSFWLLPRSSISKTPLRMANSIGLVDKGYRGELIGVVDYLGRDGGSHTVKKGDRIFQIAFPDLREMRLVLTDFLSPTSRGDGGFGSTGA